MLFEDFFKYEIKSLRSSDIINSIPISNSDIIKKIKKIFDKEKTCLKWFVTFHQQVFMVITSEIG